MVFRLALNLTIRDNNAFVDLDAPLVMNLSNPSGTSTRITNSILRGLKGKTIIDLDNVIDLETRDFKVEPKSPIKPIETKSDTKLDKKDEIADDKAEDKAEEVVAEPIKEDKPNTRESKVIGKSLKSKRK